MRLHTEINFETKICEHLAANGWLYADKDAAGFVRGLCLFPEDVLAWVQTTQPDAWDALTKNHGAGAADTLLNRLRHSINQQGTLHVQRHATVELKTDFTQNIEDAVNQYRFQTLLPDCPLQQIAGNLLDAIIGAVRSTVV